MFVAPSLAVALILATNATDVQNQYPTVEVHATSEDLIVISCTSPAEPAHAQVVELLDLDSNKQAYRLMPKLMRAAREGCEAKVPSILVTVTQDATTLSWAPAS